MFWTHRLCIANLLYMLTSQKICTEYSFIKVDLTGFLEQSAKRSPAQIPQSGYLVLAAERRLKSSANLQPVNFVGTICFTLCRYGNICSLA